MKIYRKNWTNRRYINIRDLDMGTAATADTFKVWMIPSLYSISKYFIYNIKRFFGMDFDIELDISITIGFNDVNGMNSEKRAMVFKRILNNHGYLCGRIEERRIKEACYMFELFYDVTATSSFVGKRNVRKLQEYYDKWRERDDG